MEQLTKEKVLKYIKLTEKALAKIKFKKNLDPYLQKAAEEFLEMAKCYYSDSKYFLEKDQLVNAFGAINYAHGWLDAGSKLGVFNVRDSKLFVLK
ncbi:MAG: DUF357 domain-containing protein [Nanoarchaeota archaeon]|nr:DUF357 domain-containing protein [Nanoarchaeota archaeon]